MADSRRINSHIREEESKLSQEEQPPLALSAIILSSEFWPTLKEEKLELPAVICQAMEAYTHRYEKLKVDFSAKSQPSNHFISYHLSFMCYSRGLQAFMCKEPICSESS